MATWEFLITLMYRDATHMVFVHSIPTPSQSISTVVVFILVYLGMQVAKRDDGTVLLPHNLLAGYLYQIDYPS